MRRDRLTVQQHMFAKDVARGMPPAMAAAHAGYRFPNSAARRLLHMDKIEAQIFDYKYIHTEQA